MSESVPKPPPNSPARRWFFIALRLVGMVVLVGLGARELAIAGLGATIATAELAGAAAALVTVAMLILVVIGDLFELEWAVYGRASSE